eukprot:symbB.v1.2.008215.t1/scaffold492.1/size196413/18
MSPGLQSTSRDADTAAGGSPSQPSPVGRVQEVEQAVPESKQEAVVPAISNSCSAAFVSKVSPKVVNVSKDCKEILGVLTETECTAILSTVESLGFSPAEQDRAGGSPRCLVSKDPWLAATLWQRLAGVTPCIINGKRILGLQEDLVVQHGARGSALENNTGNLAVQVCLKTSPQASAGDAYILSIEPDGPVASWLTALMQCQEGSWLTSVQDALGLGGPRPQRRRMMATMAVMATSVAAAMMFTGIRRRRLSQKLLGHIQQLSLSFRNRHFFEGTDGTVAGEAGKATKAPKTEVDADEGIVTCANRGLLQKMLSNVLDEEDEVDVTSHPQAKGKVPIITSPPSGRPESRGSVGRRMSLESQGRPLSGEQRSTPSSSRITVTTGAPRPALASYVSQPRPGSRGSMPPAEVITSPGRQKPGVRPAVQPKSKTAAGPGKATGYAGMHQARVSPSSAAKVQPASKPRCGPSAFDLVKKLTNQGDAGSDEGNFIMPSAARVVATGLLKEVIWDESCRTFSLMGEIL